MSYDEACETVLTWFQARRVIREHSAQWSEFVEDCGFSREYLGRVILDWLGY